MKNFIILEASPAAPIIWLIIGGIVIFFVINANKEALEKRGKA